jgi:hypothetical protein
MKGSKDSRELGQEERKVENMLNEISVSDEE